MMETFIQDLEEVTFRSIQHTVGGKKRAHRLNSIRVFVGGVMHIVKIVPRNANLGNNGKQKMLLCTCGRAVRKLRVYRYNAPLCVQCLKKQMGLRYRSQSLNLMEVSNDEQMDI